MFRYRGGPRISKILLIKVSLEFSNLLVCVAKLEIKVQFSIEVITFSLSSPLSLDGLVTQKGNNLFSTATVQKPQGTREYQLQKVS